MEESTRRDDRGQLTKVVLEFENGTMWVDGENALLWQKFVSSMETLYMSRGWPMEPIPWNYEPKTGHVAKAAPAPSPPVRKPPVKKKGGKRSKR